MLFKNKDQRNNIAMYKTWHNLNISYNLNTKKRNVQNHSIPIVNYDTISQIFLILKENAL